MFGNIHLVCDFNPHGSNIPYTVSDFFPIGENITYYYLKAIDFDGYEYYAGDNENQPNYISVENCGVATEI
jgi:hypothetical protein